MPGRTIADWIDRLAHRERHSATAALAAALIVILAASVILPGGAWLLSQLFGR